MKGHFADGILAYLQVTLHVCCVRLHLMVSAKGYQ